MSFVTILTILFLLGLMAGGLYLSRLATLRQTEDEELKQRMRQRRTRQSEVEELFDTLMVYDRNPALLMHLQGMLVEDAEALVELAPREQHSHERLDYYKGLERTIDELGELADNPETPSSDRQLHLMKRHFGRTMKLIRTRVEQLAMSDSDSRNHLERLRRRTLELEADAYKQQGLNARTNGDLSTAAAYYKHAKDMLINSEISYDEKTEQIRKLSRMISGLYTSEFDEPEDETAEDEAADAPASESQSDSDNA